MDPPIAFPSDWYPVAAIVLSGVVVAMVTSVMSWKLLTWIRDRKRRYHEPLLNDGWSNEGKPKVIGKLLSLFHRGHSADGSDASKRFEEEEDQALKRSSTVHSRTSLISSGSSSRASSVPPLIIQNCQPQDIHIPERRQSTFSVESGGVELGQVQAECYKGEVTDTELKTKSMRSKFGLTSSINEAAEDGEGEDGENLRGKEDDEEEEEDETEENSAGNLMFSLEHDMHRESLTVTINKAMNLRYITQAQQTVSAQGDTTVASTGKEPLTSSGQVQSSVFDPYVRILLLPDGKQKAKTRIVRRTRNPVFEETFTFYGIGSQKLTQTIVKLSVLNHDRFAKDAFLGQVVLPLTSKLIKRDRHSVTFCRKIISPHQSLQRQGEIFISLNFDPSSDKLTVIVLKGKNFPRMDIAGLADPYVKVYLVCDGQRVDKKKTQVKKRTLNPIFNETFLFTLPPHHQHHLTTHSAGEADRPSNEPSVLLRIVILDWDRVSKNEVIGKVEIGSEVKSDVAVKQWNEIMECPRKQVAVWHKLE